MLQIIIVLMMSIAVLIGFAALSLIFRSIWQGMQEMGNCRNTNELGMDVSYSDQHGDPKTH